MDRRTLLFIVLATGIFLVWSLLQGPQTRRPRPTEAPTAESAAPTESTEGAPTLEEVPAAEPDTSAPDERTPRTLARIVRESPATIVRTGAYEVEIAHRTASLRAWRLLDYPVRNAKGQLEKEPVDLIAVYSPDYVGLRFDGESLEWSPVGTIPTEILLTEPGEEAALSFRTERNGVEITKTLVFHGTDADSVRKGREDAWLGFAVDVEVTFKNLSETPNDTFARGYELRWGPGIAADREPYIPRSAGALGGLLSTGQIASITTVRDLDLTQPGPQEKDGDADDVEGKRTAWAAMHSKYFVAALLSGDLEPTRNVARRVRFSEYDAFPMEWPIEPARYRLLLEIGKPWLGDADHLAQKKTQKLLILPVGKKQINADISAVMQRVKDTERSRRKAEENLRRIYTDYANVVNLTSGTRLEVSGFFLDGGASLTDRFRLYAGPKHTKLLKSVELPDGTLAHLNGVVRLGITGPLAKGLLWLLKMFHAIVRNYGVAIILLTILVRLAMYPIAQRSSKSMKRMQNRMKIVQPEIDEVRRKYRDDPQRMNAEIMKVYSKYGINPASQLGGCLMIVAQMPIFIAMYSMLRNAAELRGEPFFLWIHDLTAPDLLLSVGGMPIRLLPLIVTGGTILQQKLNPASGTMGGSQRTMMYLMPVMFLFIFYGMASGLNLYWGISTLIGVGQQYLVNKFGEDTEENLTAADLERMARQERKKKRQRAKAWRP